MTNFLTAYHLKIIAIVAMVLNHIVIAWWDIVPLPLAYPMYAVGGLTFPIMAFFAAEGYKHTKDLRGYTRRLLVFGIISIPFHFVAIGMVLGPSLNIMFTIALSLWVIYMYDKTRTLVGFWMLYFLGIMPITLLFFEWSFPGVTMVLLFHMIKHRALRCIIPPVIAILLGLLPALLFAVLEIDMVAAMEGRGLPGDPDFMAMNYTFYIGMALAAVLLLGHSVHGQRGKVGNRWMFYIFYPAHLAVLSIGAFIL